MDKQALAFGPFRLLPEQRLLLEGEKPIRLGSRALDILITLVERSGEVISKDELNARVWPNTFVEEANLRVHVAALRKALGDGRSGARYVTNIPGRGYGFVAPVLRLQERKSVVETAPAVDHRHNLPTPLTRMIGRAEFVGALARQVARHRFVTVVGPGGIGKTTVALATADAVVGSYEDGACFVDLAPLVDARLVTSAVGSVLGLSIFSENPIPAVVGFLADKRILIVLDNCEHVIEAAATLAEELLKGASGVHVLATSREPLRATGEWVQHLPSLEIPPDSAALTGAEALGFAAIQLFVERAPEPFKLKDADVPLVGEICRGLDGIPLAIELAAARVNVFGVRGLATRLDDRFRLLTEGRRTALPRHQTLKATLDWSYETLAETERLILRRLVVFAGAFTLDSASAVVADDHIDVSDVPDGVAELAAKSLIAADTGGETVYYRLLELTRAYALEKLVESGEFDEVAQRHAVYHRDVLERGDVERMTRPTAEWLDAYGRQIRDLRAALDWAFSVNGDAKIGVALTVAAVPLWMHMSLMEECRRCVERALAAPEDSRDPRHNMQLYAVLGAALLYTRGPGREITSVWISALRIADTLDDTDYRLRAIWGLWVDGLTSGNFSASLASAQRFSRLATDLSDRSVGDRMTGISLLYLGDLTGAREHIERFLGHYVAPVDGSHIIRFQFDQRVMAGMTLSQILWLQGFPDQAMRTVESHIDRARGINHALSLCNVLGQAACPIALLSGDLAAAERFLTILGDTTTRHGLSNWHGFSYCFKGVLLIRRGDLVGGSQVVRTALDEFPRMTWALRYTAFSGDAEVAGALSDAGQFAYGLTMIDDALARSERNQERWCTAELLRTKADILLRQGAPEGAVDAEAMFRQSLDIAQEQRALSWELRTATSLARLWQHQGRAAEARDLLAPVYNRFTEGFETADLVRGRALLRELERPRLR